MRNPTALILCLTALTLAACETMPPPPPPPPPAPPPSANVFRSSDFAWSAIPGANRVDAHLAYRQGSTTFSCPSAALIPETPFTARRMITLYGSAVGAITPLVDVQRRTTPAPPDMQQFVRSASCDAQGRFAFSNLPDGSWFVITVAQPAAGAVAPTMALMRRVITRGGRSTVVEL
jgi:hypothetical protein